MRFQLMLTVDEIESKNNSNVFRISASFPEGTFTDGNGVVIEQVRRTLLQSSFSSFTLIVT